MRTYTYTHIELALHAVCLQAPVSSSLFFVVGPLCFFLCFVIEFMLKRSMDANLLHISYESGILGILNLFNKISLVQARLNVAG